MIKYLKKDDDFELLINNKVIVDFYADWCGPCKMMSRELEQIDSVDIIKIDVDLFQELARTYGVMSIPTLILFEDGKEVRRVIGFRTAEDLKTGFINE